MKNHTDGARPTSPPAPAGQDRLSAKEERLAKALRRNLSRRKQAGAVSAKPGADRNGG